MGQIDWVGVIAVAGMYAAFLLVGWLAARKVKEGTAADLIVAGRSMPLWIAVLTMTATWVDGGYLLGTAEYTYKYGLAVGVQGGVCFGLSLILGGMFFAARMRRRQYSTMVDPFEERFGKRWAAVLFLPALLGELLWSGALLVAIGSTFGVLLNLDLTTAILMSAAVVTAYTMVGGMWSVAYTDAFQLVLIPLGLLIALLFALEHVGGLDACLHQYQQSKASAALLMPPFQPDGRWTAPGIIAWWDMSIMLILGGIPWNCYFQRVLSCQTPAKAAWHSILAGLLTIALTVPPALLGMTAFAYWGPSGIGTASETLPLLLKRLTPHVIMILGLAAIIGAVTSSFSSSILSAGSMFSWNVYRRLLVPGVTVGHLRNVIRSSIVVLGAAAVVLALKVQSVAALWLFTGELVFVLLFPQLVMALYDPKANRIGSMTAFAVSLLLRLGGGVGLETNDGPIGFGALIPYPELFAAWLSGSPSDWYGARGETLFPVKTLAAVVGLVLLPVVSRLTARWNPPRHLAR
jgi:high affinity choline transporter 7